MAPRRYTSQQETLAVSFASALRGKLKIAGPRPHKSYDPYTKEDESRPPKTYKFSANGKWYVWDVTAIQQAKRKSNAFKLLLEEERFSLMRVGVCVDVLLELEGKLRKIN